MIWSHSQCTSHADCCSDSCLTYSYKCVERHQKPNTEQPIEVESKRHQKTNDGQPIEVQSIDDLIERFGAESTTNAQHTNPTIIPSTLDSMQTDQPTTTPLPLTTTIDVNHSPAICRSNGNPV